MATIPQVASTLHTVLTTTADTAARQTRFVQRRSKLTGALFCQSLVFGWLANPAATLDQLAQMAHTVGGISITAQGLEQRFSDAAAACLEAVLAAAVGQMIQADAVLLPLLQRFQGVWFQDSSTIPLPKALADLWAGGGKAADTEAVAAVKTHLRFDLLTGAMQGPFLSSGKTQDQRMQLQEQPLPTGAVRIADLGYFSLAVFRDLMAAGVFWLTRWQVQVAVFDLAGKRWDMVDLLTAHGTTVVDMPVTVGCRERLSCRLLAVRVPQAVADARRRKLHEEARRKGQSVSKARLLAADWTIMLTTVPPEALTVADAVVLLRARWQIELLFKLWKSRGGVDEWRSEKPWRILCEVYAKLLAMLVQHWLILTGAWELPNRSWVKVARTVQQRVITLADAFGAHDLLTTAITKLATAFGVGCAVNRRKTKPALYQLLLDPSLGDLA